MEKLEHEKLGKKCFWKCFRLDPEKQNVWGGMQGAAILVVIKGSVQISPQSGGESFLLQAQEICLQHAFPLYTIVALEETYLLVCVFQLDIFPFDREMLNALIPFCKKEKEKEKERKEQVILQTNELIQEFVTLMDKYLQRGLESDQLNEIKRHELFLLLFATYPKQELALFFYPLIGEGLQFKEFVISNHIKAKNVRHLAQMANYSTSGFIKIFMRYFNESPYHWMIRQKAKLIFDEINTSRTSLKEIAFKYNFSTYQHFVEFCKTQFGVTPSQLR